jgi:hypothetical protein
MTTARISKVARDRLAHASEHDLKLDSLIGSYFHSRPDPGWQGCIVAEPVPGIYLVELFDWLVGASSCQKLVPVGEMHGWRFYDDADWMNNSYQHEVASQWDRDDKLDAIRGRNGSGEA